MKSLKIVLASLLITAGVITLSAFASSKYDEAAFVRVCYEYIGPKPATSASVLNANNWSPIVPAPSEQNIPALCPNVTQPCIICFDDANTTFAEARQLISIYLLTHANLSGLADPATLTDPSLPGRSVKIWQEL